MDLDNTNFIERDEVARCLAAVLKDDPRLTIDDSMVAEIIDKACRVPSPASSDHIAVFMTCLQQIHTFLPTPFEAGKLSCVNVFPIALSLQSHKGMCVMTEDLMVRHLDKELLLCCLQTFEEADLAGDGHISSDEWLALVRGNPSVISYMTLAPLKEITLMYSSFVWNEARPYA